MSVPRFHCPLTLAPGAVLTLPEDVAHHAVRVRRLTDGTAIELFDGLGACHAAVLRVQGRRITVDVGEALPLSGELPGRITLVQGIASGDKMDWIIEKAVELGVHAVVPVMAQRSVLRLQGERLTRREQHWQRVAVAACEQCGRQQVPVVAPVQSLSDWLAQPVDGPRLLCLPTQATTLRAALSPAPSAVALLVGPEGGWSPEEEAQARQAQAVAVRFGSRVLRTETAGLALLAATAALLGWDEA